MLQWLTGIIFSSLTQQKYTAMPNWWISLPFSLDLFLFLLTSFFFPLLSLFDLPFSFHFSPSLPLQYLLLPIWCAVSLSSCSIQEYAWLNLIKCVATMVTCSYLVQAIVQCCVCCNIFIYVDAYANVSKWPINIQFRLILSAKKS